MFDKFSLSVSKIFKKAENEMLFLNHPYVGTEHLMLALLKDDEIISLVKDYNLSYDNFYQELVNIMGKNKKEVEYILYTPLLKRVINSALDDALSNHEELNSKYLLKAIIDEGEGIAIRIMFSLNVDIDELYEKLERKQNKKSKKKLEIYNIGKSLKDNIDLNEVVVGRDKEIELILETLIRKNKNNPLLIGEAGVGKTAIVEEIERRILKGCVPDNLKNKEIVVLELGSLVAGTKYRGEFEEKLTKIIKELETNQEIIVFIDEIHAIVNAGGAEGAINASDILKPYLARGKIKVIGATTTKEFNNTILKDKALMRRFELIRVLEPNKEETINILNKVKKSYETHYDIKISKDNIKDIVTLANRYILDRQNPDKSLDILDSVCAMVRVEENLADNSIDLKARLESLDKKKKECIKKNNFEEASILHEKIEALEKLKIKENKRIIKYEDILKLLSKKYHLPLLINKNNLIKNIYPKLKSKIIGQDEALKKIVNNLDTFFFRNEEKPLTLLLTGSTGVGKTESVKALQEILRIPLIRLDMSEYNLDISVNKLIGASAGYIGYNDETIFNKVKMNPFSIILVDELEKAHPSVLNLFLQIMDEGFITNSQGEKIDFKNTLIFMTSNIKGVKKIGFKEDNIDYSEVLTKEFVARFDDVIKYNDITKDIVLEYLKKNNIQDEKIIDKINYSKYGLREVKKVIKKELNSLKELI